MQLRLNNTYINGKGTKVTIVSHVEYNNTYIGVTKDDNMYIFNSKGESIIEDDSYDLLLLVEGSNANNLTTPITLESWARYVAKDKNGLWWQYQNKPEQINSGWQDTGGLVAIVSLPSWKLSLQEINK